MDTLIVRSPLAAVQLIPIINYLTMLNNFLFTEKKLQPDNKNKHIPIVNALYEYLEEYHDNSTMIEKLIRNLLKDSDLYGEEENEKVDEIFVNTMFEYIITSLVFEKYGNIYGFLADTIRNVKNFKFDYILQAMKETLANATFENEYGSDSILTELSVNRIYTDIIMPFFPEPKTKLSILSLDYIFAQAGSMYLRLGRINNSYFNDNNFRYSYENLFDEYIIVGHMIKNLVHYEKIDHLTLRVFALPALFYYISTEDKVKHEIITNVIFNPLHWETAYQNFFEYIINSYNQIKHQLINDYTYQMHLEFSHFQNRAAMAKSIIDLNCTFLNEKNKTLGNFTIDDCSPAVVLPNINNWYKDQIHTLGETYGNYDLELTKKCFNEILIGNLTGIVIKLIVTNDKLVNDNFNNLHYLSYDLFEFYYIDNKTSDYYALIRENYSVTFIRELDDPQLFLKIIGQSLYRFIQFANRIILKFSNEGINEFSEELMKYKKQRFKSYLNLSNYSLKNNEWWKEFGLSLVPFYPCLSKIVNYYNNEENLCEENNLKFLNKFTKDISSYITHPNTQSLLSIFGTTLKGIFIKDMITNVIEKSVLIQNASEALLQNKTDIKVYYNQISLHLEDPKFEAISITEDGIKLVSQFIDDLRGKINYNFTSVNYILNEMKIMKYSYVRNIGNVGENRDRTLFANSLYFNTSFGYKFINIYDMGTAILRTNYETKEKIFTTMILDFPKNGKKYVKINNVTFEYEFNYFLYEINNQLRSIIPRIRFSGIFSDINNNNEKCLDNEYLKLTKHSTECSRHWGLMKLLKQREDALQLLKHNVIIDGENVLSEDEIRNELKKYILPKENVFVYYFVIHWIHERKFFEQSDWSKICKIDNSDLFNKLRYDIILDNNNITIIDGESRINSLYTYRERCKIEEGTSIENIIKNFNDEKAGFSVTFEDYYAIRNFATSGDTRITGDTREAKLMKLALYKLAIRQSDDLIQDFKFTLFQIDSKSTDIVNNELSTGKRIILQKFTLTSTSITSATRFSSYASNGFTNILYEIKFTDPYFSAIIKQEIKEFEKFNENKVILLPGSKFEITSTVVAEIEGMGKVLKVQLKHESIEKYESYKRIMREIGKIKL